MTTDGRNRYEDWDVPPSPEGISTNEAARVMGCTGSHFRTLMRKYGVIPMREYVMGRRVDKFWNPAVVRQVKAAHRLSLMRQRHDRQDKRKAKNNELAKHHRRTARQNTERLKILQRVAERKGTTVSKLVVDKGLQDWYRSLPNKYKE